MAIESIIKSCFNVTELEHGGQKSVYTAEHPDHGSIVLKLGTYPHPRALERISREVSLLASIESVYYPRHFAFIVEAASRTFLIIEERIEGQTLLNCLDVFSNEIDIINLINELVVALDILWKRRVVHRDIKPQNIIIRPNSKPVVIDLGIARLLDLSSLTIAGALVGPCTAQYASPEQLRNRKSLIDIRSDFFALGLLALQIHLGFHPYEPSQLGRGDSIPENILNGHFVLPEAKTGTSESFSAFIKRLMQTEPHQRFRTKEALSKYITDHWG